MPNIFREPMHTLTRPFFKPLLRSIRGIIHEELMNSRRSSMNMPSANIIGNERIRHTVIRSFPEYDHFIESAKNLGDYTSVAQQRHLLSHRLDLDVFIKEFGGIFDDDPFSERYIRREIEFFEFLSGTRYSMDMEGLVIEVDVDEFIQENMDKFYLRGYIDYNRNAFILLSFLRPKSGDKMLELGFGFGNLLEMFGKSGCIVSGVDISKSFVEVTTKRLELSRIKIGELRRGQFMDVAKIDDMFEIIAFDAAFHHATDPLKLLRTLRQKISPAGRLVFLHEPIAPYFSRKWGIIRDDGETAMAIRQNKWFETGFRTDFFEELLAKSGWRLMLSNIPLVSPPAFVAEPV